MTTGGIDRTYDLIGWRNRAARRLRLQLFLIAIASTSLAPAQGKAQAVEEEMVIHLGFEATESNFDQWVFGTQDSDHGLQRLESLLALKVETIDRDCGLSELQMAKLRLAGQGDMKRFYDEVDAARAKFILVRRNPIELNNFRQDIRSLQTRLNAGIFGQQSFFQKVLNRTLDDEQSAKYAEAERERARLRHDARLTLLVALMERNIPLRAEQRDRFIDVLKGQTEPLDTPGEYDYYVALHQLAGVPDQKLRPIFDEAQWKVLQKFKANGLKVEAWLKEQKVLP